MSRPGMFTAALCLTALAFARPVCAWQDVDRATNHPAGEALAAGSEAMRTGNLAKARIDLERAVRAEPENANANLQLGLFFRRVGNGPRANEMFRKTVRAKPDWAEAHYNLALSMAADQAGKRDWPGAITEFQEAVRLRPGFADARRQLAMAYAQTGERDKAIAEFRAALAANPDPAETHLALGKVLEDAGESAEAEREYRTAVRLRPGYVEGEIAVGKLLVNDRDKANGTLEAVEHFRRALRTNPDNAAAQYALAKALQEQGQQAEAAVAFREAASLNKREQEAASCTRWSNEGLNAARKGDGEAAIRNLRQAVELRPDESVVHYNLGLVLADRGDLAAARAQVVEALSLAPWNGRFYLALGRMWKRSGDRERARAALQRATELDPGDERAMSELRELGPNNTEDAPADRYEYGAGVDTADEHFAFATVLASRGDWTGASGEWLRVLALRPNDVDARNNLGVSYVHAGKDDRAELEFRKALQVSAESPGAHFGLAVLDLERGDKAGAVRELREVTRLQPDYPQAQSVLAAALKKK